MKSDHIPVHNIGQANFRREGIYYFIYKLQGYNLKLVVALKIIGGRISI